MPHIKQAEKVFGFGPTANSAIVHLNGAANGNGTRPVAIASQPNGSVQ